MSLGCAGFAKKWRTSWTAQFDVRGNEHDEFEGEGRRVSFGHGQQTNGVVHVGAQVEKGASPGRPRRLATLAASSCVLARTQAALRRRWPRLDRAPRSISVTVTVHILPILSLCKNRPKFELKPNFHQNKSCAKFCELQNIFWWPELILSGN